MAVSTETIDNSGEKITQSGLQGELDKLGANATVSEEGEGYRIKFNKSRREYVIDKNGNIVQIFDPNDKTPETEEIAEATEWIKLNKVSTLGGYNSSKGVNAPKLGSELTAITLTDDLSSYTSNGTWYDYVEQSGTTENGGTSKWANAITTDDDGTVTGYYVWIPRYAYKIASGYHGSSTGTIEIKFLKGTTNEMADGTGIAETDPSKITYTNGVQDQWLVHPAFTASAENGGGFGEITGIWVAKYEISAFIDENDTSTREIGNITYKQIKLRLLPGVQSVCTTIGTLYDLMYNMNRKAESHMLKNSEWGAITYLAHSSYGRNGTEVTRNSTRYVSKDPTYTGIGGMDTYTGGSNTETGYLSNGIQSTTGNAYGIYDMSGGNWEYVASYINNGGSNLTTYGSSMTSDDITKSTKYKTVYKSSSSDNGSTGSSSIQSANYNLAAEVKGDAVYETSSSYSSSNSWNSDYSNFPYANNPFFIRGGYSHVNSIEGVFSFQNDNSTYGGAGSSSRPCLVVD